MTAIRRILVSTTGALLLGSAGMFLALQPAAAATPDHGQPVQAPVHVPVNVCGNTVPDIGILNPSAGNTCVNA
jgi:small secreted domain DUF320